MTSIGVHRFGLPCAGLWYDRYVLSGHSRFAGLTRKVPQPVYEGSNYRIKTRVGHAYAKYAKYAEYADADAD